MSTFTKVMIVVLTLSSFFLCGAVITYVGSAENAKAKINDLQSEKQALVAKNNTDAKLFNEKIVQTDIEIQQLKNQLAIAETDKNEMMIDLKNAQRTAIKWQDRVNSWSGVVKSFEQTIGDMQKSLIATRDQLSNEQSKGVKLSTQLNEMTVALDQHIVMLESLKAEKRRLLEQKTMLDEQIKALGSGKTIEPCEAVTPLKAMAEPVGIAPSASIQGIVSEVSNNIVALSIGTSDGVKKGMKLHVTRGDSFICDLMITDVDTNKCAGIIELKNGMPRMGDTASTEL